MLNVPACVEELTSRLLQNRITKVPSKLSMPLEQAYDYLLACYIAEVRIRQREFVFSEELSGQLRAVSTWLTDSSAKQWLLLCGSCGNGKTTMVKALRQFFKVYSLRDPRDSKTMGLALNNAKAILMACQSDARRYEEIMRMPMLAIDDLGIEPCELLVFGNVRTPVIDLLTYRYEEQLITIMTTNLAPPQIREHYGDRIADRLNEMSEKIVFRNGTYRCDCN